MHKLIVKQLAEEDAKNAANWYNKKRKGLGAEFLLVLDAEINAIQRNPSLSNNLQNIKKSINSPLPLWYIFHS